MRTEFSDRDFNLAKPKSRRSYRLALAAFAITLILLTFLHTCHFDARWQTENALLVLFSTVLAAWICPRWPVLIFSLIAGIVWFESDRQIEPDLTDCLIGHTGRAIVTVLLILWTSRAKRLLEQARQFARIDGLTGLPNRQAILETLDAEICRTRRFGRSFSIAMLDCDGFKTINDQLGHLVGDQVLESIATALRKEIRAYDCIGRLGGDEFILIISEANPDEVPMIIERLRTALRHQLHRDHPGLTFSIGVVTIMLTSEQEGMSLDWFDCLQRADEAMYSAKRSGRDQTRFETLSPAQPPATAFVAVPVPRDVSRIAEQQ